MLLFCGADGPAAAFNETRSSGKRQTVNRLIFSASTWPGISLPLPTPE